MAHTELSNRRFFILAAVLILGMTAGSWFIGHVGARGIVQTIDQGYYNAEEMKQPVPMQENQWNNGTYSNTKVNKNNVVFDIRDRLTVGSDLTITVQGGSWDWPTGTVNGNKISYTNSRGGVSYEDQDTFLKETIVLNAPVRSIEWKLNLSMKPQSLGFQVETDGYSIRDPTNENERIKIPFPFVIDAEGTRRDLTYSWNNGQRLLSLNLDDSGLIYPLSIDPTQTVDSVGAVGFSPQMLINATGYPMIVYGDDTNDRIKYATNNSGTWTNTTLYGWSFAPSSSPPFGAAIDPSTGLPFVATSGTTHNFSWFASSKFRAKEVLNPGSGGAGYGKKPIGISSSSGRVLFALEDEAKENFNITRIESISGTSVSAYQHSFYYGGATETFLYSGAMNTSNILNIAWSQKQNKINLTMATDANPPVITTIDGIPGFTLNTTLSSGKISLANKPDTDMPAIAYIPSRTSGATDTDRIGRQVNYSYQGTNGKWYFEVAATNTTGMSSFWVTSLAFNSSSVPYIAYIESSTSYTIPHMEFVHRTGAGTWSSPVTIDNQVDLYNPPSLNFDTSDGLHIAYLNWTTNDLMYYFEPLPSAGAGSAPVASFILDKSAIIRNMTVTLTDQSSNTPTSTEIYSPGGNPCFTGNFSLTPGGTIEMFPKWGGKCVVCEIAANAFGTDTSCEGSIWVARPQVTW